MVTTDCENKDKLSYHNPLQFYLYDIILHSATNKKTPITKVNKCQKLADRENCQQRDHDGRSIIVCLTLCLLLMTTECTINARHRFMSFHLFCNF